MASKKFTDLTAILGASVDTAVDVLAIVDVDGDTSHKITVDELLSLASSGVSVGDNVGSAVDGRPFFAANSGQLTQSQYFNYTEGDGISIEATEAFASGFRKNFNATGQNPSYRLTDDSVQDGFAILQSDSVTYFGLTTNNWAGVSFHGTTRSTQAGRWGFGGTHSVQGVVHAKPQTNNVVPLVAEGHATHNTDFFQVNTSGVYTGDVFAVDSSKTVHVQHGLLLATVPTSETGLATRRVYLESDGSGNYNVKAKG